MATKVITNLDFGQNQLLNPVAQNLASAPSTPIVGQFYYNTATGKLYYYGASGWVAIEASAGTYTLPVATSSVLGGVKDGTGVTIAGDGTISVDYGTSAGSAVQGNDARVTADQAAGIASIRTIGTGALQAAAGNHNHTLDGLSNVVISANSDGELLVWDTATSKWINQTLAEAGVASTGHTHAAYQPIDGDLTAIAALAGTAGFLKKTAADTWTLDTSTYLSAEADTLNSVLGRGATSNVAVSLTNTDDVVTGAGGALALSGGLSVQKSLFVKTEGMFGSYIQTEGGLRDGNLDIENVYTSYASIKWLAGSSRWAVRDDVLDAYADIQVKDLYAANLYVTGTTTILNSTEVNIGDNFLLLNSDITTSAQNSDGGLSIKRFATDNTTRQDATIYYNSIAEAWKLTGGVVTGTLYELLIARKYVTTVGGSTSVTVMHNMKTQDLTATLRTTASPYDVVLADIEFTSVDTCTVKFATAPAAGAYTLTLVG